MADDYTVTQEAYKAAKSWSDQPLRNKVFGIARIVDAPVSAYMKTKATNTDLSAWTSVLDGSFNATIDGVSADITGLSFSGASDLDGVAGIIQAGLQAVASGGFTAATCVYEGGVFVITSGTTGNLSLLTALKAVDPATGTDISGSGFMNAQDDPNDPADNVIIVDGYTPSSNIADELSLIAEAARCSGRFNYAWTVDKVYRDSVDQIDISNWAESRRAVTGLTVNSPLSLDPNSTSDVGYLINTTGNVRSFTNYHDNAYYYPEVAILAQMLSVNYAAADSTMTAKFKELVGIPTVPVDINDVGVLENKRINTYTAVGNNARTFREGTEANDNYFIDDLINLDNYEEELSAEVYNVFLQNKKVKYAASGTSLIYSAIDKVSARYVFNGSFGERQTVPTPGQNTVSIEPAYIISNTPISQMTVSDRAQRKGPPFSVKVNLSNAIHSVDIKVNAFS